MGSKNDLETIVGGVVGGGLTTWGLSAAYGSIYGLTAALGPVGYGAVILGTMVGALVGKKSK